MKKIVFLIIASILVIGVVLPGCTTPGPSNVIKIAVCGPLTDIQGENHLAGAQMARDEINARPGKVTINSTEYTIQLVEVETNEILGMPVDGTVALYAVIDDVDFVVGGFRTEAVMAYREVAMDAHKIFIDCGAATDTLQFDVVTNYAKYKYWFKATPYNSTFLVKSLLKMTYIVGAILKATLHALEAGNSTYVLPAYQVGTDPYNLTPLRVHILSESAYWCDDGMVAAAQLYLPCMGFNVTGTTLVNPAGPIPAGDWAAIAAQKPHIILTAFSGLVGDTYSIDKNSLKIPALTIGINVRGQSKSHWTNTSGACDGEIMLDTWAEGLNNTAYTYDWLNAFMAKTGDYPLYTAGTYDAIYAVTDAVEATNSLDSDTLIAYMETHAYTGVAGTTAYYPWPAVTINATTHALSADQVYDLYPGINGTWTRLDTTPPYFNVTSGYNVSDWLCGASNMPHIAHDLVYGPGYQTGIGSQWQSGQKVGVWPMYIPGADEALTDQYGCWNFEYDGTVDLYLPIGSNQTTGGMLTIPYNG